MKPLMGLGSEGSMNSFISKRSLLRRDGTFWEFWLVVRGVEGSVDCLYGLRGVVG